MNASDIFLGIIAIIFPPLAVSIKRGLCSADFLINIALSIFGFIPGLIHAWYIIAEYSDNRSKLDNVETVGIVSSVPNHGPNSLNQVPNLSDQTYVGYGSTSTVPQPGYHVVTGTPYSNQFGQNEDTGNHSMPPSYLEAMKGDYKVQTNN